MRVLILGAAGMLGHKVFQVLSSHHETWATFRGRKGLWSSFPIFAGYRRTLSAVDAREIASVIHAFAVARPQAVVNCIGIVKQLKEAKDSTQSLRVNALFPHELAELCRAAGARLIHISTDCVFAGTRGHYGEGDLTDAEDLYGRTKALGEVTGEGCLTLRTSIIGRDFLRNTALVEWFLSQRGGRVRGYRNAIYSGFPTVMLAEIIANILEKHPGLTGLYHVASPPISKYDLLIKLRDALTMNIEIEPFDNEKIDRSLNGTRFEAATGFISPDWDQLVRALADDPTPYDAWRREHVVTG